MAKSFKVFGVLAVAGFLTAIISGGAIAADEGKLKISSIVDELKISGDLRLREETRWYNGIDGNKGDTNRQRFRLRISADAKEGPIVVHIRLASGTGEQVSTNQSMGKLSAQKAFWIDRAYVEFKQVPMVVLSGGRMSNPFFQNKTSAIVWDDDYNPEGFAQSFGLNLNESGRVFANLAEIILDGGGSGSASQWLMGLQGGGELKTDPATFNVAVLFYTLANWNDGTFSQSTVQDGNTRVIPSDPTATPTTLVNPYRVINATLGAKTVIILPVAVSFDIVRNMADTVQADGSKDANTGFAVGFVVGKASDPNTAELGAEYRSIETDATLADLNDSDFGPNGGTNRKGFKVWTAYNLTKAAQLKLTLFNTKVKDDNLGPAPITTDETNPSHFRFQADASVKF